VPQLSSLPDANRSGLLLLLLLQLTAAAVSYLQGHALHPTGCFMQPLLSSCR
jgi:hypothetical protein